MKLPALLVVSALLQQSAIDSVRQDLKVLESFGFSGTVVIAEEHRTLLSEGYGTTGGDPDKRVTANTLFDIGSLAKQFTAAAILRLEADNKLRVTDSVARFFPLAPAQIGALTIHQLLTHTSGLARGNLTTEETTELDPLPRDSALARLFRMKPQFAAGSRQAYSNAGYVLLAAIVEEASGISYLEFVRQRLWRPARIRDARFWGEPASNTAMGKDDLGEIRSDPRRFPLQNWSLRGAGGILMSADDLHRWFDALLGGRVLTMGATRRMMSPQFGTWGYAWRIGPVGGDSASVYHGGDFTGFGSQLIWQPHRNRLIIILTNVRHEDDTYPTRVRVEEVVFARLNGTATSLPPIKAPSGSTPLSTGVYASPDGARFQVARVGQSLFVGALNQSAAAFLAPAPSVDTAAYRASLTQRTVRVIEAAIANDSAAMRRTLSSKDDPPYVLEQLLQELGGILRGRKVTEVVGLGTFPAATPAGALWSVVELRAGADTLDYMLRWHLDVVASYHTHAPSVAARLFVVPSGDGWLAWDIVRRRTLVQIERVDAASNRLRLANGVGEMVITRTR